MSNELWNLHRAAEPDAAANEIAKLREQLAERDKLLEARHYYNGSIGARQLAEIEALREQLASMEGARDVALVARDNARDSCEYWTQRAEAAESKLKDWTRRSESCESKLGQLEANEQVMLLEAKLKALDEPVMWFEAEESARNENVRDVIGRMMYSTRVHVKKPITGNQVWPLYAAPIPPADVQELQRTIEKLREGVTTIPEYMQMVQEQRQRIAELERKLAEQQERTYAAKRKGE